MANLEVSETNVPGLIKKLKTGEWLAPLFQRDFVWSNAATVALINSIIDAKPIGMVTLWEQENPSQMELEHISIPDWSAIDGKAAVKFFGLPTERPGRYYAILDGRQRSTALALAFGGLRASFKSYRTSGRYFLDVTATDDSERVKFIAERDVLKNGYDALNVSIANGLFPLEVNDPDRIFETWMNFLQHLRDPGFYKDGKLPGEAELERRNKVLQTAFNGIINTKIAVYTVPRTYSLAEICEIFETLNTTGTKVSTVDLIHSWLYSDTIKQPEGPVLLRDKLDEIGELDGAVGWSSSRERPELMAQFVAAAHVALDNKPEPRQLTGAKATRITSVKSQDLLAIPQSMWRNIFDHEAEFAQFIGDFQEVTTGGRFPMKHCPYPASASIYVALRWYLAFDKAKTVTWQRQHLDNLYRAFFWRNVLLTRYDQGFLTSIGNDIREMKEFLARTKADEPIEAWRATANSWLDEHVGRPSEDSIVEIVSDGSQAGALRRGSLLLLYARATKDVIDTKLEISPESEAMTLHHVYPKDWCKNNIHGPQAVFLDEDVAKVDWVNSAANLIPMHRTTNNEWRKKLPSQFLGEKGISYESRVELFQRYFISKESFNALMDGVSGLGAFWTLRQTDIANEIQRLTRA